MINLLLIHHSGGTGGAGVSLLHIIRKIDKSKFKVFLLCPEYPTNLIKLISNEDCQVISSNTSPKIFAHYNGGISCGISLKALVNIYLIIKDKKNIENYINEINPDIIAVNSMTLFWIGKISKKLNKKTVCFHRETYQKGLFGIRSKIIKCGLSKWFDKVAFISLNDFNETGNIRAERKLIYDRVDLKSFNKIEKKEAKEILGLDKNKKYILYLGGISELKGSDVIMKAMKYIEDDNTTLLFIDDIDHIQRPSLGQFTKLKDKFKYIFKKDIYMKTLDIYFKSKLQNTVLFMQRTNNPELYYKASDVVVFPSTKAHQSRPIYEAGIAKIPVLITEFKQTKEFALNEVTAITFKNKNSYDLANKIKRILQGKYDLNTIVANNYRQVITNHDLETLSNDLEDFFDF